jgi:hypothetical protein
MDDFEGKKGRISGISRIDDEKESTEQQVGTDKLAPTFMQDILGGTEKEQEDSEQEDLTNKNRQGNIRTVESARLIYKRKNDTSRYDELWIFNIDQYGVDDSSKIKDAILAGTDIPEDQKESETGEENYEIWHVGDMAFLKISNLPN